MPYCNFDRLDYFLEICSIYIVWCSHSVGFHLFCYVDQGPQVKQKMRRKKSKKAIYNIYLSTAAQRGQNPGHFTEQPGEMFHCHNSSSWLCIISLFIVWVLVFREQQDDKEKTGNGIEKAAPKKQPLSLEEMIARREAEKKAQEKVGLTVITG